MLIRLGDGASGGREPVALEVSKVPAPLATKTAVMLARAKENEERRQATY
jgi:hypothetical protein